MFLVNSSFFSLSLNKTKNFVEKKLIKGLLIIKKNRNIIKEHKTSDILTPNKVYLFNSAKS